MCGVPTLCIRERGTKRHRLARHHHSGCTPIPLPQHSACPELRRHCAATGMLFRPRLAPDQRGFKDSPLRTLTLSVRLMQHLRAAGLYEGETVCSFRCGAVRAYRGWWGFGGCTHAPSQLRTPATLGRYLDEGRHMRDERPVNNPCCLRASSRWCHTH